MPGNLSISQGNTTYKVIAPSTSIYSGKVRPGNSATITANTFYEFGEVSVLKITLQSAPENAYNEYMFEFTAGGELIVVTISGTSNLKWARTPQFRVGFRYQISILNDIALWTEVAAT